MDKLTENGKKTVKLLKNILEKCVNNADVTLKVEYQWKSWFMLGIYLGMLYNNTEKSAMNYLHNVHEYYKKKLKEKFNLTDNNN